MLDHPLKGHWALILGASSGFGEAVALELAAHGIHIFGVHMDRKATLPNAERIQSEIKAKGAQAVFFNMNAADAEARAQALDQMQQVLREHPGKQIKILLHSLAFGTLRRYIPNEEHPEAIGKSHMDMTLDVMANSLVYWTQDLMARDLMGEGGRIYSMTSSGGTRQWPFYGAVSAAKAALESHTRQLAVELAPLKITVNAIRAGVTDTPALRKIPGSSALVDVARERNPGGRLTTPQDVADAIVALSMPHTHWLTGNTIGVDGGEDIVG